MRPFRPRTRFLGSRLPSTSVLRVQSLTSSTTPASTITPISSLLIANRGEIALRVHRTADRLGIRTTAVYTDPDARAQHAAAAHRALNLGDARAYLDGEKIISLAKKHGINALHPGYGFLSENPSFARRCEEEGIVFVGPPAQAMADMGDKARSKEIMTAAGVPCVPGYHGVEQGEEELLARAREIVFPVLLKSVRGGGGKGMRIVLTENEFVSQLRSARAEALAAFGEGGDVMLVEKYIVCPRHVEVQVFADRHGNCVALGERDCSVQRRHQKILEESPAPGLDEATRRDLWDKARTAALAVGYVGAGTVEFIFDKNTGQFYFMEMNTRLQVEHPVSEMVTGTDLVEWQLLVAAGARLPLTQEQIIANMQSRGAAIEARIYAERPEQGFLPDSGTLLHLRTPTSAATDPDVRIDAGFVAGDVVSEAYDGMIAKLIVRGPDRTTAIRKLHRALQDYEISGLGTNIAFLQRLCESPEFVAGDVETGFVEKYRDRLFAPVPEPPEVFVQAALSLLTREKDPALSSTQGYTAHGQVLGFGPPETQAPRSFAFRVADGYSASDGETIHVTMSQLGKNEYAARVSRVSRDQETLEFPRLIVSQDASSIASSPSSHSHTVQLTTYFPSERAHTTVVHSTPPSPAASVSLTVFHHGRQTTLHLAPPPWFAKATGVQDAVSPGGSGAYVTAPMPCKILRNEVIAGAVVTKGAPLVVIESMKMETVIRAPRDGVVKKVVMREGDICKVGAVLVYFEEAGAEAKAKTK